MQAIDHGYRVIGDDVGGYHLVTTRTFKEGDIVLVEEPAAFAAASELPGLKGAPVWALVHRVLSCDSTKALFFDKPTYMKLPPHRRPPPWDNDDTFMAKQLSGAFDISIGDITRLYASLVSLMS